MTSLGEYALRYAAKGRPVFPVHPATKAPRTPHGMKDATTDPDTIAAWWQRMPDSLIGSRIPEDEVVLDIDPRHGGLAVWDALEATFGPIESLRHYSGRGDGGFHLWLKRPPGRRLSAKRLDAWAEEHELGRAWLDDDGAVRSWSSGIDLLHHRHRYSILPPSPHPVTGQPYVWSADGPDEIAECPDWLADLITEPEPVKTTTLDTRGPLETGRDRPIDGYNASARWADILIGWNVVKGDGESPGSAWRHPAATSAQSATIGADGRLYVFSPNTPFETTEEGRPHGYDRFAAWATLTHRGDTSAALDALRPSVAPLGAPGDLNGATALQNGDEPPTYKSLGLIDWGEFWAADHLTEDWLCEPLIAAGRNHAIVAKAKAGKSLLVLEAVAAIATGRPFLRRPAGEPRAVMYLDYEMAPGDLYERLVDLGYGPDADLSRLHYFSIPQLPALDTRDGGHLVTTIAHKLDVALVVIDTAQRVITGSENDAETIRDLYRHTLAPLKAAGIATVRTDHLGKDGERGARGSSAKQDDVDIQWTLKADGDKVTLTTGGIARISWAPETVRLCRTTDVPMHTFANPADAHQWDAEAFLRNRGRQGATVEEAARGKGLLDPTRKELNAVRNLLRRLEDAGKAFVVTEPTAAGGTSRNRYHYNATDEMT